MAPREGNLHYDIEPSLRLRSPLWQTDATIEDSRDIAMLDSSEAIEAGEMDMQQLARPTIGTTGLFPMMELPSELRLCILNYLLICPDSITIDTSKKSKSNQPSVAILQTCKQLNEEGTPILYSQNNFIICLTMDPAPSCSLTRSFILRSLRWSTLNRLSTMSFISNGGPTSDPDSVFNSPSFARRARPSFTCTGADILARFASCDFRYSPSGPDQYMALSISNWISMQVMRAELSAFQRDLEAMMRPSDVSTGLFADDPAA